jgi:GNAT superfamily N-acetyltransferase
MKNCYVRKLSPTKIAIADLCDYYGKGLIITRINVPKEFRGQGVARGILKEICDDADRESVTLFLEILESDGLRYYELENWYLRAGFKHWKGIYRRLPSA